MKSSVQTCEQTVPPKDVPLGAVYDAAAQSCRFSLWAPTSRDVSVNLYQNAGDSAPAFTLPLQYDDATGLWCGIFAERDPELLFYDYTLTNETGTHTVLDPAVSDGALLSTCKKKRSNRSGNIRISPCKNGRMRLFMKCPSAILPQVPTPALKISPARIKLLSKKSPTYANWALRIFS